MEKEKLDKIKKIVEEYDYLSPEHIDDFIKELSVILGNTVTNYDAESDYTEYIFNDQYYMYIDHYKTNNTIDSARSHLFDMKDVFHGSWKVIF